MRVTPDLVDEIVSRGSRVEVLQPQELRAQVSRELEEALRQYTGAES